MLDRQKINNLASADCHIHPDYSIDAKSPAEDYVRRAIELGLRKICFTTHIDLDPHRDAADFYMNIHGKWVKPDEIAVNTYLAEIDALKQRYSDKLEIIAGFEFSYEPHFAEKVRLFLEKFKPKFSIGSVHAVDKLEITSRYFTPAAVRSFSPQQFIRKYYDIVIEIARSDMFSVIGHIDGYKKYLPRWWGLSLCEDIEGEIIGGVAKKLADAGAAIEVNTSGWRKGLAAPYPSAAVINELVSAGVEIGSFGSDAHFVEDVGYRLKDVEQYIIGAMI